MKHTTTSVSSLSLMALATAATLTSNAFAGAPAKPAAQKEASSLLAGSILDKVTGSVDVGYDSGYYFRGLWFSNNNIWEGLTLNLPVTDQLTFTLGALYTSSVGTNINIPASKSLKYSELDLIASASYDAGFAKFGLVYTYYNFYDTFSGTKVTDGLSYGNNDRDSQITTSSDLGFTVSKSVGPVNLNAGYWYDFRIGGQYVESSADCPIEITPHFSVVPSVSVGYGFDYYTFAGNPVNAPSGPGKRDGFTAVRPALSFPVKITETATFTPYAAMNLSGSARYTGRAGSSLTDANTQEGRNDFYFGGKMSVAF
jgi:hypothetical protein